MHTGAPALARILVAHGHSRFRQSAMRAACRVAVQQPQQSELAVAACRTREAGRGVYRSLPSCRRGTRLPSWLSGIRSESAGALPPRDARSALAWILRSCGLGQRAASTGGDQLDPLSALRHRSPHPPPIPPQPAHKPLLCGRTYFGCKTSRPRIIYLTISISELGQRWQS